MPDPLAVTSDFPDPTRQRNPARQALKAGAMAAYRPLGTWRLRRAAAGRRDLKVELGAGPHRAAGWLCTDVSFGGPYYLDGTVPWPLPAGSVSHVFADNVIEHLDINQNRALLRHAFRAMRPGAVIRLDTPDVESLARAYVEGEAADVLVAAQREKGYVSEHRVDALRVAFVEHGHHVGYLFDCAALDAELRAAGFGDVERQTVNVSTDPALCDLEPRSDDIYSLYQLIVEARKPA